MIICVLSIILAYFSLLNFCSTELGAPAKAGGPPLELYINREIACVVTLANRAG